MSELFYRKLNGTDWERLNYWKDELIRLLDERRVDDHVAWKLAVWLDDLIQIAAHEGLFKPGVILEHNPADCARIIDRLYADMSYAQTTGHYHIAVVLALTLDALQARMLSPFAVYCQGFMIRMLRDRLTPGLGASDFGSADFMLTSSAFTNPLIPGTSFLTGGPKERRPSPSVARLPYLITGPGLISYDLIDRAAEVASTLIECARNYVTGAASRFELNAAIGQDLYTEASADEEVRFLERLFPEDVKEWLDRFLVFWNSQAEGVADTSVRTSPDDPTRRLVFAGQPRFGGEPGEGWRLLHTARLLGAWPIFDIR